MKQNIAVYPGHNEQPDPTMGPRVRVEGEPNYIRNKGTIKVRVFDDTAPIVRTPKPEPRCPTSDSRRNYKASWFGTVPRLLNGTSSSRPKSAPARVKPEAEGTAFISRGPRMKVIVHEYARSRSSPRRPRVKPEGQKIAEASKGARISKVLHNYGTLPVNPSPVPRLRLDTKPSVENNQGKRMSDNLHKYGQNKVSSRPQPRVTTEGEDNAELDKGRRMEIIFKRYGKCPLSSKAMPRVKHEGEPNATLDAGFRMSRLMHDLKSVPGTPRPVPRTTSSQAKSNSLKGRGSMHLVFQSIASRTFIHVPGQQSRQYARASIA